MFLHCATLLALMWPESWVHGQTRSPCPDVFQYRLDGAGSVGVIQARPPGPTNQLDVETNLTIYGIALTGGGYQSSGIKLKTHDRDRGNKILNGQSVEYTLSLRSGLPVPVVNQITVNGVVTCRGEPVITGQEELTRLWAKASLTTSGQPKKPSWKPGTTRKPQPPPIQNSLPGKISSTCGQAMGVTSLVYNGRSTERGQAPWVVAMFRDAEISIDTYFCTGTLISRTYFITAAHCLKPQGERAIREDTITAIMGKFNLSRVAEGGQQMFEIDQTFIHPDYERKDNYDADLAVVKLASPVTYSHYVQPICMKNWRSEMNIAGKDGLLVSWGLNEEGTVNQLLKSLKLPIVGLDECRRSYSFLQNNIVDRMLCAGARDKSGPCVGDSGGGLVISRNENGVTRWYLRGVVSIGIKGSKERCNLSHYVAFTDLAKFAHWLAKFQ